MRQIPCFFFILFTLIPGLKTTAQDADSLLEFVAKNKSDCSFYLIRNDTIAAALNENEMRPLAGTMEILVAVEFAKQTAFNVFDTSKMVSLKELNKYYIPFTDENAHPAWLNDEREKGHIKDDSISLINVARGMILFGSNANTEYLMDLLGLQNINGNYRLMGIKSFTPLYYPVSSLFLYQNPRKMSEEKVLDEVTTIPTMDYIKACNTIHDQLKNDTTYKSKFNLNDLTARMQREWSNRLPASSAKTYAQIGYILNKRKIFEASTYQVLSKVLEDVKEYLETQSRLQHAGKKRGTTMFVLTETFYATLKDGSSISIALFFNNLVPGERHKLEGWLDGFDDKILNDREFRDKLSRL